MNRDIADAISILEARKDRSAWNKGVTAFAVDLLKELDDAIAGGWFNELNLSSKGQVAKQFLNGADNWLHYAWSGCGLVYNEDIAQALCAPWELRKTDNGRLRPNGREDWLDVYARAMHQACYRAIKALPTITDGGVKA